MAAIKIDNFVGEVPAVSPRKLGAAGAQVSLDVHAGTNEFIPLLSDVDKAAGVAGAQTLFLLERDASGVVSNAATATTTWKVHGKLLSYARCQIKDNKTARTVRSYDDVDQAPEILTATATGTTKLLGVPTPTVAPLVKLIASEEFTADDRVALVTERVKALVSVVRAQAAINKIGLSTPDTGYLDSTSWAPGYFTRVYEVDGRGSKTVINAYSAGMALDSFAWVGDAGGFQAVSTPVNAAWQMADKWHECLKFRAYTNGFTLNTTTLAAALGAVNRLAEAEIPLKRLLTSAEASELAGKLGAYANPKGTEIGSTVASFNAALERLKSLLSGTAAVDAADWVTFFAASADAKAKLKAAIDNFANGVAQQFQLIPKATGFSGTNYTFSGFVTLATTTANTAFVPQTSGPHAFNTTLTDFITAQFVTTVTAKTATTDAIATSAMALVTTLKNAMAPTVWIGCGGYPQASSSLVKTIAASVKTTVAELDSLGAELDRHYGTLASSSADSGLDTFVSAFVDGVDTDALMPAVETRILEDRFYGYTWVTGWGEESSMSPLGIMVQADTNDVCQVTIDVASVPTGRDILGWRLYRSAVSTAGAGFQMVPDLSIISKAPVSTDRDTVIISTYEAIGRPSTGTMAYDKGGFDFWKASAATTSELWAAMIASGATYIADPKYAAVAATCIALQGDAAKTATFEVGGGFNYFKTTKTSYYDAVKLSQLSTSLESGAWLPPPANLRGATNMANGIMAGYFENMLCFSEAYKPHAWPFEYQQPLEYPIVGLASYGQTLFIGTRGAVMLASGADPSSISVQTLPGNQSCVSARSIVPTGDTVIFASPDGICSASAGGVTVITSGLFSRRDWQALKPETIVAAIHDGVYYFSYKPASTRKCYALDLGSGKLTSVGVEATAFFNDTVGDGLYATVGNKVVELFSLSAAKRTGKYRTGITTLPKQEPLAWLQVFADGPVTVKWYGDGGVKTTVGGVITVTPTYTVTVNDVRPVRLPAGRYLEHEIEIESQARITSVTLAGDTTELQSV